MVDIAFTVRSPLKMKRRSRCAGGASGRSRSFQARMSLTSAGGSNAASRPKVRRCWRPARALNHTSAWRFSSRGTSCRQSRPSSAMGSGLPAAWVRMAK